MYIHRMLLLIVFFKSALVPAAAQQSTSDAANTLNGVRTLRNSLAKLNGGPTFTDISMAGTARRIAGSDDETGPAIFKALATGESRLDLSLASGPRSEVRGKSPDGPVGSWSGPDGRSHPMARHNLYTEPEWLPANAVSSLLSLQNLLITEIRAETRGDSSLIHLTTYQQFSGDSSDRPATLRQNLSRTEILLDADTLRPIILIFNTHPDDDALVDIPIEIHFSDYRTVSGTQVPFHVQKFFNGSLLLDLQFETASINSGLSAGEFAVSTQQ